MPCRTHTHTTKRGRTKTREFYNLSKYAAIRKEIDHRCPEPMWPSVAEAVRGLDIDIPVIRQGDSMIAGRPHPGETSNDRAVGWPQALLPPSAQARRPCCPNTPRARQRPWGRRRPGHGVGACQCASARDGVAAGHEGSKCHGHARKTWRRPWGRRRHAGHRVGTCCGLGGGLGAAGARGGVLAGHGVNAGDGVCAGDGVGGGHGVGASHGVGTGRRVGAHQGVVAVHGVGTPHGVGANHGIAASLPAQAIQTAQATESARAVEAVPSQAISSTQAMASALAMGWCPPQHRETPQAVR